jgi:dihydrolipoamide dehydrogenase
MADSFDVVVIGSGPGGYVAGIKASQAGLKAAVIEKDRLGGICLNWGCIPTKALLRDAELYSTLRNPGSHGFTFGKLGFDGAKIVEGSRKVADKMSKGVASLLRKYKVEHIQGAAAFVTPREVEVTAAGGKTQRVQAKDVIVATGASARAIPAFPVDRQTVITYREALELKQFPKKLLIVGAGAIGVEFAYYFSSFEVEVHLVEMLPQLLPNEDSEISDTLFKSFRRMGIQSYVETAVKQFSAQKGRVDAVLENKKGPTELTCDMALIAAGMEANARGIGAEKIGLALDKGFIRVNERMQTNVPHVYAIGDVAGRQLLAHKASAEAELAVAAIAGHAMPALDYGQVPACTYCQPQVASIGLTEKQCQERNIAHRVGRFPFAANGKATALRHNDGMVKLIFGEPYGQLLGAHLIGPEVTELLAELGLAMRLEATNEELLATIHAHPTLSEAVFEAVGVAYGSSANL